jgi:serine/threonine protein kinase
MSKVWESLSASKIGNSNSLKGVEIKNEKNLNQSSTAAIKSEITRLNDIEIPAPEINKPSRGTPSISEINWKDPHEVALICNENPKFKEDIQILSFLNSGSCGVVHLGEIKTNSSKKVALKILVSNKVTKSKREKISKKEMFIMNKLKNKNSINLFGIYEVGSQKDIMCLVMEYAKYGDIENFQRLIHKKTFNETLIAYITKQILQGLMHCKNSNIIHLDIKHQNLLIDENLSVKLSDYSVSFELPRMEKGSNMHITLPVVGTSLFMSPEILSKSKIKLEEVNKVDTYCLGVLIYHLAFASYPYDLKHMDKKNFEEILKKISTNKLEIPELAKHSEIFRDFLRSLLINKIDERLSVEDALNHEWMHCAELIFEEKEKIVDLEKFLISLVTDNVKSFNNRLKKK